MLLDPCAKYLKCKNNLCIFVNFCKNFTIILYREIEVWGIAISLMGLSITLVLPLLTWPGSEPFWNDLFFSKTSSSETCMYLVILPKIKINLKLVHVLRIQLKYGFCKKLFPYERHSFIKLDFPVIKTLERHHSM